MTIRRIAAADVRTGDRLVLGSRTRMVTQAVHSAGEVVLHHGPTCRTFVGPRVMVQVDRSVRVVDHDTPELLYRAG